MAGITDVAGVEMWGKGRGGPYDLTCGMVDADGKLHRQVWFREMDGDVEDRMDDATTITERMTVVLSACVTRIGDVEDPEIIRAAIDGSLQPGKPVTSPDRLSMMLDLRRVSIGDVYTTSRNCPSCGHLNRSIRVDLREIERKRVPESRVAKRRATLTLSKSGKKAVVRVLTAKHEADITNLDFDKTALRSLAILARLDELEGDDGNMVKLTDAPDALARVKALPVSDRVMLRHVYDHMEGDVDTTVHVRCSAKRCLTEFSFPIDVGQSLFSSPGSTLDLEKVLEWS